MNCTMSVVTLGYDSRGWLHRAVKELALLYQSVPSSVDNLFNRPAEVDLRRGGELRDRGGRWCRDVAVSR